MPSDKLPINPIEKSKETKKNLEFEIWKKGIDLLIKKVKDGEIKDTMYDLSLMNNSEEKENEQKKGVEYLSEKDFEMWKKINTFKKDPDYLKNLDFDEFKLYRKKANEFNEEFLSYQKEIDNPSRHNLCSFLTQKWSSIWLKIQAKEYEKKKKKKQQKKL